MAPRLPRARGSAFGSMARAFNYERAAQVLAEADLLGDQEVSRRYGISVRSIKRYRARAHNDPKLALYVSEKKTVLAQEWAAELGPAIREAIAFLHRAAQKADPENPQAIHAVAGALKILADVAMTRKVLDARLSDHGGAELEAPGAVATAFA